VVYKQTNKNLRKSIKSAGISVYFFYLTPVGTLADVVVHVPAGFDFYYVHEVSGGGYVFL
jgi:hypothetical protein